MFLEGTENGEFIFALNRGNALLDVTFLASIPSVRMTDCSTNVSDLFLTIIVYVERNSLNYLAIY